MSWGCYRHEMNAGTRQWDDALAAHIQAKADAGWTYFRDGEICPLCIDEKDAELALLIERVEALAHVQANNRTKTTKNRKQRLANAALEDRNAAQREEISQLNARTVELADLLTARSEETFVLKRERDEAQPLLAKATGDLRMWMEGKDEQQLRAEASERRVAVLTHRKTVVLSGSSRFIDVMAVAAWREERAGHIALSCHLLPNWYTAPDGSAVRADHQAEHEGIDKSMDTLHLEKIIRADEMLVIDVRGYVGESTRTEIAFAEERGIPIRLLSREMPAWYRAKLSAEGECMFCRDPNRECYTHGVGLPKAANLAPQEPTCDGRGLIWLPCRSSCPSPCDGEHGDSCPGCSACAGAEL